MAVSTKRTHLLTDEEVRDLIMALDVLCGCYSSGVNGPEVQSLLKRYAGGTKGGERARALFHHLPEIGRISIQDLPDRFRGEE